MGFTVENGSKETPDMDNGVSFRELLSKSVQEIIPVLIGEEYANPLNARNTPILGCLAIAKIRFFSPTFLSV